MLQSGNSRQTAPPTGTLWSGNSTLVKRYVQRALVFAKPNSNAMIATADTQFNIIIDGYYSNNTLTQKPNAEWHSNHQH